MTLPHVVLRASADPRLLPRDMRVYITLYAELDTETYRPVKLSWLARRVGRSRQGVSPAIARLVEAGYIRRGRDEPGGICTYRITLSPKPLRDERAERRAKPRP